MRMPLLCRGNRNPPTVWINQLFHSVTCQAPSSSLHAHAAPLCAWNIADFVSVNNFQRWSHWCSQRSRTPSVNSSIMTFLRHPLDHHHFLSPMDGLRKCWMTVRWTLLKVNRTLSDTSELSLSFLSTCSHHPVVFQSFLGFARHIPVTKGTAAPPSSHVIIIIMKLLVWPTCHWRSQCGACTLKAWDVQRSDCLSRFLKTHCCDPQYWTMLTTKTHKFRSIGATLMRFTWTNVTERGILVSNFSMTRNSLLELYTLDRFRHVSALPENRLRRRHVLKYATQLSCIRKSTFR